MKQTLKEYLRIIFIAGAVFVFMAQVVGDKSSLFSIAGWNRPADDTTVVADGYTPFYPDDIKYFEIDDNPGGYLNWQWRKIDSLFNALVVFTDSTQMGIVNDTLRFRSFPEYVDQATAIADGLVPGTLFYNTTEISVDQVR